jgi:hypothetical protein
LGRVTDIQWEILQTYHVFWVENDLNKVRAYALTRQCFSEHLEDLLWLADQINLDPKFYKGVDYDN